ARQPADHVVAGVLDVDAVGLVAQPRATAGGGADEVPLHRVAVRAVADVDPVVEVARDHVPGGRHRSADDVVAAALDADAVAEVLRAAVGDGEVAGGPRADQVAEDQVAGRVGTLDVNALKVVTRDQVPPASRGAADHVSGAA